MEASSQAEREARAARNQSLFRSVNERVQKLNEAFEHVTETFTIACECADRNCVEMLDIAPEEYEAVRSEPRHFAVLAGHIDPAVERITRETEHFVVVEKVGTAGEVATALDPNA